MKVFEVKRDLHLTDVSENLDVFEYEDAIKFCKNAGGYYSNWSYGSTKPPQVEICLCDAPNFLEYTTCKRGNNSEYSCECFLLCPETKTETDIGFGGKNYKIGTNDIFKTIHESNMNSKEIYSTLISFQWTLIKSTDTSL